MIDQLGIQTAIEAELRIKESKTDRGMPVPDPYFDVQGWVIALVSQDPKKRGYLFSLQGVISAFIGANSDDQERAARCAQDAINYLKKQNPFDPEFINLIINQLSHVMPHGLTVAKLIEEGLNTPIEDD